MRRNTRGIQRIRAVRSCARECTRPAGKYTSGTWPKPADLSKSRAGIILLARSWASNALDARGTFVGMLVFQDRRMWPRCLISFKLWNLLPCGKCSSKAELTDPRYKWPALGIGCSWSLKGSFEGNVYDATHLFLRYSSIIACILHIFLSKLYISHHLILFLCFSSLCSPFHMVHVLWGLWVSE